jgi:hypothetical protein
MPKIGFDVRVFADIAGIEGSDSWLVPIYIVSISEYCFVLNFVSDGDNQVGTVVGITLQRSD